ncbi:MAG: tetratricopeptide repeat protein [Ferruginibacter sp.]
MNKNLRGIILFVFIFTGKLSFGQADAEIASMKAKAALKLEDEEQKYDEAIILFREAQLLDPQNINYPYEIAYAYTEKKEYKKASDILETLLDHKDVFGMVYQALGNAYDNQGMREKAIQTYENGLKKFPNSGELYLELGNMQTVKKEYTKALAYYEKGIEMDPRFPSNYYWAAKIFCSTEDEVWGMIYGELFLNLERGSTRATEINKMLFRVYKTQIKFSSDSTIGISFSKNAMIDAPDAKDPKKIKMPFGSVYEMAMSLAVVGEKQIDINSLHSIRKKFLDEYFRDGSNKNYPNILFDYQNKIKDAGHLEAYDHWILMKGDEQVHKAWLVNNRPAWVSFFNWMKDNPIQIDATHKFYRAQY